MLPVRALEAQILGFRDSESTAYPTLKGDTRDELMALYQSNPRLVDWKGFGQSWQGKRQAIPRWTL